MNQLRRKSSFTVPIKDVSLSQMLERNEASQETGFTIPEAPSQPCKNLTNEGDVNLSQIIGKRPYPKFTAPVLNKEMNDKSDYSVFSQKDLSLSQMLASPPRRSQSLRDNFAENETFKTPMAQNQRRFQPPVFQSTDGESKNTQVPARKLVFPTTEKQLAKTELFKTDFSFDNVPQAQPFIMKEKPKPQTKTNFDPNMCRTVHRENHQHNSNLVSPASRRPLFQSHKNPMFDSVPEAPSIHEDMFQDANKNFSVSHAIKTQQNKPYDSQYHGSGSTTQMTLFKSHKDRENKMNEGMNKTPACFKPRNNDHVYTPALLQLPGNVAKLRSVEEIPGEYQDIFEFPYFNIIQSMVFDDIYYTDNSMIVSAPTGSGKTVIFEIAIVRLLFNLHLHHNGKIIYMAPIKALCSERFNDWNEKFGTHGIRCKELTGDTESDDFQELQDANLILTTPEKWDSMSRKWKDNKTLFHTISLFLVDEIHILNDSNRGATVEAVLSRMKTLIISDKNSDKIPMRFVAVSATIPNIQDLAEWLGRSNVPALSYKLEEKYRPVKLQKIVLGYHHKEGESEFKFDINLNYKLKNIIDTYSNGRPTLVFCSSRKMVNQSADVLIKQNHNRSYARREDKDLLKQESLKLRDSKVSDFVSCGVGVHHAGMDCQDRHSIEELFRQGVLPILVATSTLAMGVNLPAHLVILKSTTFYNMGCPTEYPDTQILQMIGRAGRPQFDSTATAVIMTKTSSKSKYESVVNGTQTIESSLHKNLIEHLNAEIVLHTITDMGLAVEWIRHTFLYVRIMKNPSHYGVPEGLDRKQVEKQLEELCLKSINSLAALNLVKLNEETLEIESTETGRLMARYCIAFDTMTKFHDIKGDENIEQLLTITTTCQEFQDVTLRQTEKTALNQLNKDKQKECIRYPMQGKIKNKQMKVNCLVQASFGCLPIHDYSLTNDVTKIFRVGQRVVKCLFEFLWQRKEYKALVSAIQLSKCFKQRLWEDSKYVTKQLEKIGTTISLALATAGLTTFHKLSQTNPREIELIANRHPPFGNQVKEAVAGLPKYQLAIEQIKNYKNSTAELIISINLMNRDVLLLKPKSYHQAYFIIGDTDNNIVFKWRVIDSMLLKDNGWRRKIEVQRCSSGCNLYVHLLSQDWVGVDIHTVYVPVYLNDTQYSSTQPREGPRKTSEITHSDTALVVCAHKCVNKMHCGHKCCKDGVANKRPARAPKTPSQTKDRHGERGLGAQIKNLQNRAQDFPSAPPDIKRPRLNTSIHAPPTHNLNLTRFAYDKSRGTLSWENTTPWVEEYDDIEGNIEVEDGWERLNQHQQQQQQVRQQQHFNQGNFNLELSPVVEEDGISYSPLDNISICSIEDFNNPPEQRHPATTINDDMITYWDPGFSSDDDVVEMINDTVQKNSIIIGKAPQDGLADSWKKDTRFEMGMSNSAIKNDSCHQLVDFGRKDSLDPNALSYSDVKANYQRTNQNSSKFDINNHYSNLDSDSDGETMETISYETDNLPSVKFAGRRGHNSIEPSNNRNMHNLTNQINSSTNSSDWFKLSNQRYEVSDDEFENDVNEMTNLNSNIDKQTSDLKHCYTSFESDDILDEDFNKTANQETSNSDFRNKISHKMNELKNSRRLFTVNGHQNSDVDESRRDFEDLRKEILQKKKGVVMDNEKYSQVIPPVSESPASKRTSRHFTGTSELEMSRPTIGHRNVNNSVHAPHGISSQALTEACKINNVGKYQTDNSNSRLNEFEMGRNFANDDNKFGAIHYQVAKCLSRNNLDDVINASPESFEDRPYLTGPKSEKDLVYQDSQKDVSNMQSRINIKNEQRLSNEQVYKKPQKDQIENVTGRPVPIFKKGPHHIQHSDSSKEKMKPKFNLKSVNYTYSSDDTKQLSSNPLVNQDRFWNRPEHNPEDVRQNTQRFPDKEGTNSDANQQRNQVDVAHNFKQFSDGSYKLNDPKGHMPTNIQGEKFLHYQDRYLTREGCMENGKHTFNPSQVSYGSQIQTPYHQREATEDSNNEKCLEMNRLNGNYPDGHHYSQLKSLANQKPESVNDFDSPPRNKEHRYGQVLAWVPEDCTSPRPTTLPLKSPVPPPYLSQSPPVNTTREKYIEDYKEPVSEKQFGLSHFFCPVVKNQEVCQEEDNFNSLFDGIF